MQEVRQLQGFQCQVLPTLQEMLVIVLMIQKELTSKDEAEHRVTKFKTLISLTSLLVLQDTMQDTFYSE